MISDRVFDLRTTIPGLAIAVVIVAIALGRKDFDAGQLVTVALGLGTAILGASSFSKRGAVEALVKEGSIRPPPGPPPDAEP